MKSEYFRTFVAACIAALWLGGAGAAAAQGGATPKIFETNDHNGVNLDDFNIRIYEPKIAVGDPDLGGLYWQRWHGGLSQIADIPSNSLAAPKWFAYNNLWGQVRSCDGSTWTLTFSLGNQAEAFDFMGVSQTGSGSSYSYNTGTHEFTYNRSDGAVLVYKNDNMGSFCVTFGRIQSLTKPDGEVITWNYYTMPSGPYAGIYRLQSITNNLSYQIHFQYLRDTAGNATEREQWDRIQKVTAIDNAINPCSPTALSCNDSAGAEWPYLTYGYEASGTIQTVTDRLGNVSRFQFTGTTQTLTTTPVGLIAYRSPQDPAADVTISQSGAQRIVTNARGQWAYSANHGGEYWQTTPRVATVTGPNGYSRTVTYIMTCDNYPFGQTPLNPISDVLNGRTTTYTYTSGYVCDLNTGGANTGNILTRVTGHDGEYVEYEYAQGRRNVTREHRVAKPGSGLADINTYASYPEPGVANCANTKTCNRPLTTTDARGNVTTFTYDPNHGGLLTATKPAPGSGPYSGIQPQIRNTYQNGLGIIRLSSMSMCNTTSSCTGTADEAVVDTAYNTKRMPSTVTTRAGNSSIIGIVTTAYTSQGDVESIDGPLPGTADTIYSYYDSIRRLRAIVSPDPDQGGPRLYGVMRMTYNADGNPVVIDKGEVGTPPSWDSLSVYARVTTEYDSFGRKVRENTINLASGQPETVVQTSYDIAGRVACVARRMNTGVYDSLPDAAQIQPLSNPSGGACAHSPAGSFGPDQIVRSTYYASGDLKEIQSGYGTSLARNERAMTYLAPGQVETLKDAANNLTTLEYDGFNRLRKTRYPIATVGANSSSTSDYEEIGYDAANNITSERRRDGVITVANTYDNLNRLTFKNFSDATPDVTNSYDNLDHLVGASSSNGAVSWGYDALGRVMSEAQPNGTVQYNYDDAGRRIQLLYPNGGFWLSYQYYDDGALKLVGLNGTSDVLASYYYDTLHRRASVCRSAGTSSSCSGGARTVYGYDAASRLSGMSHDLVTGGSTYDLSETFSYSPASQLTGRTASVLTYEWPYSSSFNEGYAVNGLNQYTTVAGQGLSYDGRGNTTNDTTKSYDYDAMNRLTSSNNGASAVYDATGRLLSISQSGPTTKFLYDGTRLIAEYDGGGALQRRYVHGDGVDDPMVWFEYPAGTRSHLFKDERGSVIAADDGSGVTTKRYDEYGNASAGGYTGRFQYTGQTWMAELALYYYKARAYNPDLGRFMQTDPIGTMDQINLYAYVGNDPLNRTDSSGKHEDILPGFPPPDSIQHEGEWRFRADPNNSRGGNWVDDAGKTASWEGGTRKKPGGHWDVDDGKGGPRQRFTNRGVPITAEKAHAYKGPAQKPIQSPKPTAPGRGSKPSGGGRVGGVVGILTIIPTIITAVEDAKEAAADDDYTMEDRIDDMYHLGGFLGPYEAAAIQKARNKAICASMGADPTKYTCL